jgi:cytochrome P450
MNHFDPLNPAQLVDPYPAYARYREHDPVHFGAPGEESSDGTWYVFGFEDVVAVLQDRRFGREVWRLKPQPPPAYPALAEMASKWMFFRDPPEHTRLRTLVAKAFTPRVAESMRPRVRWQADRLLETLRRHGRIDVIADYARLLPTMIIAEVVGAPPEECELFLPWSIALAATLEFRQTDEVRRKGQEAVGELIAYLRDLAAQRRSHPQDDLLSALLRVEDGRAQLSEDEVIASIMLLLTAGNDPTQHLIGNGVLALLRQPAALHELRETPALIDAASDELLRYDSSVQATFRYALEDVELRGRRIAAGQHVAAVFGSALRDPAYCARPDELDFRRKVQALPYGFGIHFCLGMPLARVIGQIALERIVTQAHDLRCVEQPLEWEERFAVRGLKSLWIEG